jgi:hypothetical protein
MKATVMLCDHAQEVAGKLYILGGGWSIFRGSPITMALAIKIAVPWDEANKQHDVVARLVTEDGGNPVLPGQDGSDPEPRPVEFQGRFEAGRPPGLVHGTDLDAPLAINIAGLPLPPGRYEWQVLIDGELVDRLPFGVMPSPGPA